MPIYEYECEECHRKSSHFIRSISNPQPVTCPRCGGARLTRLLSRFAMVRSEEDRLDRLADSADFGDVDESDPKSFLRAAKRMAQESGEDMGEDFEAAMEEAAETEESGDGGEGGDDDRFE
jgi:putative FmdB family regulatory protein